MMALPGFVFGGSTGLTQDELERRRAYARQLLQSAISSAPQNVGEGLTAVGRALAGRFAANSLKKDEAAAAEHNAGLFSTMFGKFGTPPTPAVPAGVDPATTGSTGGAASFSTVAPRLISDLSTDFGLSSDQAAGVVGQLGHESGGFSAMQEKNPLVPGSKGGFGYAQWTGPRRRAFEAYAANNGLNPTSYEANYGFLKNELSDGNGEGKVLGQLRLAKDAQSAGRVFTDQFLRPGIPG